MQIGSEEHKELFCREFLAAHRPYEAEDFEWPDLDEVSLGRLRAIPFWGEALANETDAGAMIERLAATVRDPLIREAVALQGFEEARHGRIIRHLLRRYDIPAPEPTLEEIPADVEKAFVGFGYSECLDSFGAFGLFELARQSGYFPPALFTVFGQILDEEAQHTVFFINWLAHLEASRGRGSFPFRALTSLRGYGSAIGRLVSLARSGEETQEGFTTTGASSFLDDLTPARFVSTCISENRRRMAPIHRALLRPRLLPAFARAGLPVLRLIPIRSSGGVPWRAATPPTARRSQRPAGAASGAGGSRRGGAASGPGRGRGAGRGGAGASAPGRCRARCRRC